MMFGMLGNFLPGAAATLLASNPVLLGAGALFGGLQLRDERKRKVVQLRQAARQQVRQFLDDVQFEVGNEITNMVREVQRSLRDEFTDRLAELQRTATEAASRAQATHDQSQQAVQARLAQINGVVNALAAIEQRVTTPGGGS